MTKFVEWQLPFSSQMDWFENWAHLRPYLSQRPRRPCGSGGNCSLLPDHDCLYCKPLEKQVEEEEVHDDGNSGFKARKGRPLTAPTLSSNDVHKKMEKWRRELKKDYLHFTTTEASTPRNFGLFDSWPSSPQIRSERDDSYFKGHEARPYYDPSPSYSNSHKTMLDVDFTPLFLVFLPMFLALGTLLGLGLSQASSTTSTTTTTPNIIVNVNATANTATPSTTSSTTSTNNTNLVYLLFTNGTLAFPFPIFTGTTGLTLGTTIFGGLFPFAGFGRSLSHSFWSTTRHDYYGLFGLHHDLEAVSQKIKAPAERLSSFDALLCGHCHNFRSNSLITILR